MPSLKAIRKRIGSVKNTQKITRAMKLMSAARLRRAQDAVLAARPYSDALERVVADLASVVEADAHPLLAERPQREHVEILVLTSDRGLAGSFNAALLRRTEAFVKRELGNFAALSVRVAGRKGRDYFRRRECEIASFVAAPDGARAVDFSRELANFLIEDFIKKKSDAIYLAFNRFKGPGSQEVTITRLLPIGPLADAEHRQAPPSGFLYEPTREDVLNHILPLYLQNRIYRAALESIASELGARMAAMDAATRNAGEMISKLTLEYNRARQAAITKELLEIIAGAESLKG
jgi:F-type H+-transporting ATPase subunit gamma